MHNQLCEQTATSGLERDIDDALTQLPKHSLADLSNSKLMNRIDSKFLFPSSYLPEIITACKEQYSALEIEGISKFHYRNLYFDTPELNYYHNHHNRKLNRHKVRHRHYSDTEISYLEVKFKNNKGRTIKTREEVGNKPNDALTSNHCFLLEQGIKSPHRLKPTQQCTYDRISFTDQLRGERITLDLNIQFASLLGKDESADSEREEVVEISNFVIAELKQAKLDRQSPFFRLMRKMSVRPQSFSKYCMGLSLTSGRPVKSNRFKSNILKLKGA